MRKMLFFTYSTITKRKSVNDRSVEEQVIVDLLLKNNLIMCHLPKVVLEKIGNVYNKVTTILINWTCHFGRNSRFTNETTFVPFLKKKWHIRGFRSKPTLYNASASLC